MKTYGHRMWLTVFAFLFSPFGCGPTATNPSGPLPSNAQIIRVRLLCGVSRIDVSATGNPTLGVDDNPEQRQLLFPKAGTIAVTHDSSGWRIGAAQVSGNVLTLSPPPGGLLSIDDSAYRGSIRLVPLGAGFDVVNDVEVDDYLKGVLARELYHDFHIEAYKAQAVVARTYALYHSHTEGVGRYWDVYADERSQVYGGVSAETDKSRQATDDTAGLVLTYGAGDGHIFEAFFSSDSGGVTQAASDAFGSAPIPPLEARDERGADMISPYHDWAQVVISKDELTRRIRLWASRRATPRLELGMAPVANVQVASVNPFGRPRSFRVTDANGAIYIFWAEEMRSAFNTDAPQGATLPSSFCKAAVSPDGHDIIFYDGHGLGHGVGMSQWCAQQWATEGHSYEDILVTSYPQAQIERAY